MSRIPQAVLHGYKATLEVFVRRARRIETKSRLADTPSSSPGSTARPASTSLKTAARCT